MDIENSFKYHAPNEEQQIKYKALRSCAKDIAGLIKDFCPDSREKSIAFTKLQECIMWANASIACNEEED